MSHEEEISDAEKVRIVSDFILHAPPGKYALIYLRILAKFWCFKVNSMKFSTTSEFC